MGNYRLDASVDGLAGLVEFSAAEYATRPRMFEGEKDYHAPAVPFLEWQWNLILGTVRSRIYKIAPYLLLETKQEANPIAMATLRFCTATLGNGSMERAGFFVWDTTDGNVVFHTAETAEGLAINLFLTSNSVQTFTRVGSQHR